MTSAAIVHSSSFRRRRFFNWFPMGLTYALLYMGRYNLTVSKNALGDLMTKEDFGIIFGAGTITYAFAFLLNGPLVDKIGGRLGILIAALGAGLMNLLMGLYLSWAQSSGEATSEQIRTVFSLLYAANMYFQSYGAVSIVKVNAHWFHVRERGGFSGIFGTMISSGIFLAFTVNGWILDAFSDGAGSQADAAMWVFYAPAVLLFAFFVIEMLVLRDSPSQAGFDDFDTKDASSGEEGETVTVLQIMKRVVTNPIILTVALIEFCTGVIRNGVMHWFPIYAKEIWVLPGDHYLRYGSWDQPWLLAVFFAIGAAFFWAGARARGSRKAWLMVSGAVVCLMPFLQGGWGGILFVAGVVGANVAGWVSDLVFGSRRAPVAGILYGVLTAASIGMFFTLGGTESTVGWAKAPGGDFAVEGDGESRVRVTHVGGQRVATWGAVDALLVIAEPPRELNLPITIRLANGAESREVQVNLPTTNKRIDDRPRFTLQGQERRIAGMSPSYWLLPKNGMRLADFDAPPEILALQPNDAIRGLAGTADALREQLAAGTFGSWEDVSRAVAAVPAEGIGTAKWNPEKRMCTYDGTGVPEGETASTGILFASIERDGQTLDVMLRDPMPQMRAGDKRVLAAGPTLTLDPIWLALIVFVMSIAVIGTHGLLSGTATMDFGGRKGAATAVGMIDGFVYLGTGLQSFALGALTTMDWSYWPAFLFPFGILGCVLLGRIWHAIPKGKKAAH